MINRLCAAAGAAIAALVLVMPLSAEEPALAAGAAVTVGSHDYSGVSLSADAAWKVEDLSPYARAEIFSDSVQNGATLGGGTWKTLKDGLEVKGGLAVSSARLKGADESGSSLILELGLEQSLGEPVLGAEYRLTSGSAGNNAADRVGSGRFSRGSRISRDGRRESFTANEVSAYGRLPAGTATLGARFTVYSPSDSDNVVSETLSASLPLTEALSGSVALTFEQTEGVDGEYLTVGLRYKF